MGARGPKSAAELSTIGPGGVAVVRRPEPPADLSQEMAETWRGIVNGLPADWITPGSAPVLAQLCRHTLAARRIGQLIAAEEGGDEDFNEDRWLRLLARQEAESKQIAALATRLRLTPQSRYTPHGAAGRAGKATPGDKPWDR